MTSHEVVAYFDMQPLKDPPYHEQIAMMHEVEMTRENALKQQGAREALQSLTVTLSALCLRTDVKGDHFFGLHEALEVVRGNLDVMKGGIV